MPPCRQASIADPSRRPGFSGATDGRLLDVNPIEGLAQFTFEVAAMVPAATAPVARMAARTLRVVMPAE